MIKFTSKASLMLFAASLVILVIVSVAAARNLTATKKKLPRDDVYYEINNDNGDHGNYWETYHVPLPDGRTVFCVVYSDQIGKGGGAGPSCDWAHAG